jgi:hypothetical protein
MGIILGKRLDYYLLLREIFNKPVVSHTVYLERALKILQPFIEITEPTRSSLTGIDTAGYLVSTILQVMALCRNLFAKSAFLYDALLLIQVAYAIGTSHDTKLTSDALLLVNLYCPIVFLGRSAGRTDMDAERILAMLARHRQVVHLHIRVIRGTFLEVRTDAKHLQPEVADRDIICLFTRYYAGKARNAAVQIGDYRILGHSASSPSTY